MKLFKETPGLVSERPLMHKPFPVMNYFPWVETLNALYLAAKASAQKMVEGSRLVLHPDFHSIRLSKFVLECAFATYLFHYSAKALIGCTPCHRRFYSRYGFAPVEGTSVYRFGGFEGVCLLGGAEDVPTSLRMRLQRMAEAFDETGEICYKPSDTGEFCVPVQKQRTRRNVYSVAA